MGASQHKPLILDPVPGCSWFQWVPNCMYMIQGAMNRPSTVWCVPWTSIYREKEVVKTSLKPASLWLRALGYLRLKISDKNPDRKPGEKGPEGSWASHHPYTEYSFKYWRFSGREIENVSIYVQSNQRSSSLFHLPRENLQKTKLILDTSN